MIMAVDFLPSVEYEYSVDKLIINDAVNTSDLKVVSGSKAIYALKGAKILQSEVLLTGILGGFVGKYIKHHMDIDKIKSDITWTEAEAPHSITIRDTEENTKTIIKQVKHTIDKRVIRKAIQKAKLNAERVETSIIECRDIDELDFAVYGSLVSRAKRYNVKTIITTQNKEILQSLAQVSPYAMVFNLKQLEKMDFEVDDVEKLTKELIVYLKQGVHYIGVDLKERGALLLSLNKLCYLEPMVSPESKWNSDKVTGSFLGGIAVGIDRKYEQEKIGKIAYALALAARENEVYNKSHIDRLFNKVKVREMSKELYKVK